MMTRTQITALVGRPLPEADLLLGAPAREDSCYNGSSGSVEVKLRIYHERDVGCFAVETDYYLKYAYGNHRRPPERSDYRVARITWFASVDEMKSAMATWSTDLRSDND